MKTLIINGSPNKHGETVSMIEYITKKIKGEYRVINTYYVNVSPCNDCGYCHTNDSCSIKDDMTELYAYIGECDNIILASPLYFSQFSGSFLSFMSRIQLFSVQKYIRGLDTSIMPKKGAVLLNGGGSTIDKSGVMQTSRILMGELNCKSFKTVCYVGTDKKSVTKDKFTLDEMDKVIDFLNN